MPEDKKYMGKKAVWGETEMSYFPSYPVRHQCLKRILQNNIAGIDGRGSMFCFPVSSDYRMNDFSYSQSEEKMTMAETWQDEDLLVKRNLHSCLSSFLVPVKDCCYQVFTVKVSEGGSRRFWGLEVQCF